MVTDIEAIDIDLNGMADLTNCKGHNNAIKGATGSRLWQDITLHNVVPVPFSCKLNGDELTSFTPDFSAPLAVVGNRPEGYQVRGIYNGEPVLFFITKRTPDDYRVKVDYNPNQFDNPVDAEITNCVVTGKINAQYYDQNTSIEYMLQGHFVCWRRITDTEWQVYFNYDANGIQNTESQFSKIGDNITLLNSGGVFVLGDVFKKDYYVYKANGDLPDYPLDKQAEEATTPNPSTYRYLYTYQKQTGPYNLNRASVDTFTEVETPPFLRTDLLKEVPEDGFIPYNPKLDYTQHKTRRPIEDSYY
jgi:hypothetical protein